MDPLVKLSVAAESGPRMTPAGVDEYCWYGSRMSLESRTPPVMPVEVKAMAGIWTRSDKLSLMYSDTRGASVPALEIMSRALGVETER